MLNRRHFSPTNLLQRKIFIISITKDEAMFMRKKCPWVHISKQTTNGKRFMEEERKAMFTLREYRSGKYGFGGKK